MTELALAPFDLLPPTLSVLLISVLTGVFALLVVRGTTPQARLARARDRMLAAILEMRLFLDSPGRVFAAQGRMLRWATEYTALALPAILVMALPLTWLALHLDLRYGLQPLPPDGDVLVRVELDRPAELTVLPSAGIEATAPPFSLPSEQAVLLRLRVSDGAEPLRFDAGGRTYDKLLSTGSPASPNRLAGFPALFAVGREPRLPGAGPVTAIRVPHERSAERMLGLPWWGLWLLVSTGAGFALRGSLGVEV